MAFPLGLLIALFGGGYLLLVRKQLVNPLVERMVSAAVILGFVGYIFSLLNPTNTIGFTVLYVIPLAMVFIIAAILPERKGRLWPYDNRTYTRRVMLQVWSSIVLTLGVFILGFATIYGFYFPNSLYPVHPSWLIPNPLGFDILVIFTVSMGAAFLLQFWRFVRMLPPRKKE